MRGGDGTQEEDGAQQTALLGTRAPRTPLPPDGCIHTRQPLSLSRPVNDGNLLVDNRARQFFLTTNLTLACHLHAAPLYSETKSSQSQLRLACFLSQPCPVPWYQAQMSPTPEEEGQQMREVTQQHSGRRPFRSPSKAGSVTAAARASAPLSPQPAGPKRTQTPSVYSPMGGTGP